jgi:hypothetical protein
MGYQHRKRIVRLKGSHEDAGKYFRCWNCGVVLSVDRNLGSHDTSGSYVTDAIVTAQTLEYGGGNPISTMDGLGNIGTIIEQDAAGNDITDYYTPRLPEVSKGCWFCGTTNL